MTSLLLTLQAASNGSGLGGILCLAVLILGSYFLFRRIGRKWESRLGNLVTLLIICAIIWLAFGFVGPVESAVLLGEPIIIIFAIVAILGICVFAMVCRKIYMIAKSANKTKQSVISRQKSINSLAYILLVVISFASVVIITASVTSTSTITIGAWANNCVKTAFLMTMALVLSDNLIGKLCSPIYTVEDIAGFERFNLYLRSFEADTHQKQEEILCKTLNWLFPTIAIGDPNTVLRPAGAKRLYATDSEWQSAVETMMQKAQLIVVRCGLTAGTMWELQKIKSLGDVIKKTVFIIDSDASYQYVKTLLQDMAICFPDLDFAASQWSLFAYQEDGRWLIRYSKIGTEKQAEQMINDMLSKNSEIDEVYSRHLDSKHHSIKYLFSDRVPREARRSLNWGILSPLINFRHWPFIYWLLIFGIGLIAGLLTLSRIPMYAVMLMPFLFGRRIEWLVVPTVGVKPFLKQQNREAALMWCSNILTSLLTWIAYAFFTAGAAGIQ